MPQASPSVTLATPSITHATPSITHATPSITHATPRITHAVSHPPPGVPDKAGHTIVFRSQPLFCSGCVLDSTLVLSLVWVSRSPGSGSGSGSGRQWQVRSILCKKGKVASVMTQESRCPPLTLMPPPSLVCPPCGSTHWNVTNADGMGFENAIFCSLSISCTSTWQQ